MSRENTQVIQAHISKSDFTAFKTKLLQDGKTVQGFIGEAVKKYIRKTP